MDEPPAENQPVTWQGHNWRGEPSAVMAIEIKPIDAKSLNSLSVIVHSK